MPDLEPRTIDEANLLRAVLRRFEDQLLRYEHPLDIIIVLLQMRAAMAYALDDRRRIIRLAATKVGHSDA